MTPMPGSESSKIRILLLSLGSPAAAGYGKQLEEAGFDVIYGTDPAAAVDACRQAVNPVHAALVVDEPEGHDAGRAASMLCEARPGLPCVLLPAGTPSRECEVAVRTALRWNRWR